MRISRSIENLLMIVVVTVALLAVAAGQPLPALGADPTKTSVSGLSSGAFMAVQYDVAYSASSIGAGIVAGGPYNCAWVNLGGINTCMKGSPSGTLSYYAAKSFAALGQIDSPDHLKSQKIYIFSGTKDAVVKQTVVNAVWEFFKAAQVPENRMRYVKGTPAGHAFLSDRFGNSCATTKSPFVDECRVHGVLYDQPKAILTQIYGPLHPKVSTLSAAPVPFDQTEFTTVLAGMAKTGYVYMPTACRNGGTAKCAVHVVFHGCLQNADNVGDSVYGKLGYNEWADSNGIIVLYPQVDSSVPLNPKVCWDWWGYTGLNFQTQSGAQLSAVRAMVERLTQQ